MGRYFIAAGVGKHQHVGCSLIMGELRIWSPAQKSHLRVLRRKRAYFFRLPPDDRTKYVGKILGGGAECFDPFPPVELADVERELCSKRKTPSLSSLFFCLRMRK